MFLVLGVTFFSCTESINDNRLANEPPNTFLFLYPDEGVELSQQKSRLRVHWWGDDPDGLIIGYYFNWQGLNDEWTFTTKNDSTFSLPIGTVDTSFVFRVVAVDNSGNGKYDSQVMWNDINFGPEPFKDENGNGVFNAGEFYYDIGMIDPTPAVQSFPIKNSAPTIEWTDATQIPGESFPVMTVGWEADDLDGKESIVKINLALNDTIGFISLERSTNIVTLRIDDINSPQPAFEVLINGSDGNIFREKLTNLRLNDFNRLYVQAVDLSGAKSRFIPLPDTSKSWYVKNPKGNMLIVDDYSSGDAVAAFYDDAFNSLRGGTLQNKYDIFDIEKSSLPYPNITFFETIKLFKYIYWYGDSEPSLDLLSLVTQKYIDKGGKVAFSMTFKDSSATFSFDLTTLQNFLPVDSLGQAKSVNFVFPGANIFPVEQPSIYPILETSTTIAFARTYHPNVVATRVYNISSGQISGNVALIDAAKKLFFIGVPLHQCNRIEGSVQQLLEVIFFDEFGLTP